MPSPIKTVIKNQEQLYSWAVYAYYTFTTLAVLGISVTAPKYADIIDFYLSVYICLFLMYRFNPLRTNIKCTNFDKRIIFSSSILILLSSVLKSTIYNQLFSNLTK
jgi:hypothetical protein